MTPQQPFNPPAATVNMYGGASTLSLEGIEDTSEQLVQIANFLNTMYAMLAQIYVKVGL